ncbi:phage baseplate assembly protein V [Sphingomonas psychrotolerans]|uniref:Phage baseplate assembly protein V n=1 Tax=Sphingomonas psychrotolerans TaxID=1327635 RepID=A0ABU3N8S0_9SPHN|nr:phage baseplate assembly protein V [Sphingomonas psychrotolerans]MDT8760894.1 phage baseplate assembly protein V [Sphingomonas psychrotolerans]
MSGPPFWGKYRGTVLNNIDPEMRGRLNCMVPDVLSVVPSSWAEPCTPLAGPTGPPMGVYLVPPIGAGVWIEFEHGDPDYPIWVGCRWGSTADVPPMAKAGLPVSPSIVLQTAGQNMVVISDLPGPAGGIMIQSGASIVSISQTGISLVAPKVEITAATINLLGITDVNQGALKVT